MRSYATALARADRTRTAAIALAGAASALLVLARLDFALMLVVIAVAIGIRWRTPRRWASWAAGCAAVAVPAALWWLLSWGHVLSTSATVKNATLGRTYTERFGGRFTLGYADYLVDVTRHYLGELAVWSSLGDRSVASNELGVPAAIATLLGLGLLGLAVAGWIAAGRRRLVERRSEDGSSPFSATAWALSTILVILVCKAALDIATAPLWADKWYSAPQQLAIGFVVGAGAWMGVRLVAGRSRPFAIAAIAILAILAIPVNAIGWRDVSEVRHASSLWQDQNDLAADWILSVGPPGLYGARDAGLLAYRLDGTREVVNLDGLVNDYDFAELGVGGRLASQAYPLHRRRLLRRAHLSRGPSGVAALRPRNLGITWSRPVQRFLERVQRSSGPGDRRAASAEPDARECKVRPSGASPRDRSRFETRRTYESHAVPRKNPPHTPLQVPPDGVTWLGLGLQIESHGTRSASRGTTGRCPTRRPRVPSGTSHPVASSAGGGTRNGV